MPRKQVQTLYRAQYLCTQKPGTWRDDDPEHETPRVSEAITRALQIRASRRTPTRVVDDAENVIMQPGRTIAA